MACQPESTHTRYRKGSAEHRLAGQDLAGGWRAQLWTLVGDMEYMVQRLHLPHYSLKKGPCAWCRCTGDDSVDSWKDCRPTASWITKQWSASEHLGMFQFKQCIGCRVGVRTSNVFLLYDDMFYMSFFVCFCVNIRV